MLLTTRPPRPPSRSRRATVVSAQHHPRRPPRPPRSNLVLPASLRACQWAPSPEVARTIVAADAFCFDVDSTISTDEALDAWAAWSYGYGAKMSAIAEITARAMNERNSFREALRARMDLLRPTRADAEAFRASRDPHALMTRGVADLVATLHDRGKDVYLVSGGFRTTVEPFADALGIPRDRVWANTLRFDDDGSYAGFDLSEPTSRPNGGKATVIAHLRELYERGVVMIGDGVTDSESEADVFVGYGGVAIRDVVAERADWFLLDFEPLRRLLL